MEVFDSRKRLIKLDGEYDLTRKDEIAGLFGSIDGESSVVIDMTTVTYMDASFLRELRMLRLRDEARSITLAGANRHIRRVLKIVNFDELFEVTDCQGPPVVGTVRDSVTCGEVERNVS